MGPKFDNSIKAGMKNEFEKIHTKQNKDFTLFCRLFYVIGDLILRLICNIWVGRRIV